MALSIWNSNGSVQESASNLCFDDFSGLNSSKKQALSNLIDFPLNGATVILASHGFVARTKAVIM